MGEVFSIEYLERIVHQRNVKHEWILCVGNYKILPYLSDTFQYQLIPSPIIIIAS